MREEVEKLPEVAERLSGINWSVELNIYQTEHHILFNAVGFVNGAWYAYQQQQKKIDAIVECVKNNTADYELDRKIQELLK